MRAVVIEQPGDAEVMSVQEVPDPVFGPDEILVAVQHSAVNRADVLQRLGAYPDPQRRSHDIPGLEYAGVVSAVGDRVTRWAPGDKVMGIESGGCYAELVATHERQALPVPEGLDLSDAAAVPEVFLTAWDALVVQGGLRSGQFCLVHAGASGVGTAAIQIAPLVGARIAVTASAGKLDVCAQLGADLVIERSPHDWLADLKGAVPEGVDVILDVIGGDEVNRNLSAARPGGTIVQVGLLGGGVAETNVGALLAKKLTWIGTTLRSRPLEQKIALSQRFAAEILGSFSDGKLKPIIHSRFAMTDVAEAHRLMESNANVGKILLDW